jgi:hypothetical protein
LRLSICPRIEVMFIPRRTLVKAGMAFMHRIADRPRGNPQR